MSIIIPSYKDLRAPRSTLKQENKSRRGINPQLAITPISLENNPTDPLPEYQYKQRILQSPEFPPPFHSSTLCIPLLYEWESEESPIYTQTTQIEEKLIPWISTSPRWLQLGDSFWIFIFTYFGVALGPSNAYIFTNINRYLRALFFSYLAAQYTLTYQNLPPWWYLAQHNTLASFAAIPTHIHTLRGIHRSFIYALSRILYIYIYIY